ncbi:MAG: M12 family metallo-peptidase, partial [Candidatus Kariarchaeaceae archaeon]
MRWRIGVLFLLLSVSPLVLAEADTIQTDDHITASVGYVIPTGVVIDFFLFNTTGDQTLAYWDNYVLDLYEEINFLFQNSDIPVFFDVEHIMVFQDQTENEAAFDYIDIPNNEIDVIELLSSFSSFVDGNSTLSGYEEIQLLSGSDFTNNTAGLAWLADPTQTTKFSSFYPRSVVQATFPFDVVAKIAAHEIAHNYSATHDGQGDNSCNQSAFIMSPFISSQTTFSSCSIDELSTYLEKSWFDTYEDTTTPILTDITDFDVAQEIGQFLPLIWDVTDDHPGYYTLSIDDLVVVDNERINGSTIEYLISLDLAGNYSIELNITDLVGHHASDTFTLEIGGDLTPR